MSALLTVFARDVILTADWYLREELRYLARHRLLVVTAVGISLVAMVATLVLSMFDITSALFEYGAAFVSLLVAVCLGALRLMGAAENIQTRIAACAEVRSALIENIDRFEDAWRGKLAAGADEAFLDALRSEIGKARAIVRDERKAYYASLKSLDEVLGAAETQVTGIRGAALALVGFRGAEKKDREDRREEQTKKEVGEPTRAPGIVERELAAARRELASEEHRVELLTRAGLDETSLHDARMRPIEIKVQVYRLEAELRDARARIRI